MNARYVALTAIASLIFNIIHFKNVLLIMSSILILLLICIPNLYVKLTNRAKKVKESDRIFVTRNFAGYSTEKVSRSLHKFVLIFSLVIIYLAVAGSFLLEWLELGKDVSKVLFTSGLGALGWIAVVLSLILATIHLIQLIKVEAIFKK